MRIIWLRLHTSSTGGTIRRVRSMLSISTLALASIFLNITSVSTTSRRTLGVDIDKRGVWDIGGSERWDPSYG
jgi:hypothetical protein